MRPANTSQSRHVHVHMMFIVVGFFLILIGDSFLREGISKTGLDNAIVSRHITSAELYDFWGARDQLPTISHDYMPLGYLMEGWMMRHVGNSYLTEKVISLSLFLFCAFLVVYVWRLSGKSWRTGWIPLAFWLLVPVVSQTATQNHIELPHTICTLIAISAQMKLYNYRHSILSQGLEVSPRRMGITSMVYNTGTALWLSLAFFFKGFTSIYVFFFPAVVWFFSMREKHGNPLKAMLIMAVTFCIFVGGTCLISPTVSYMVDGYLRYRFETWLHPGKILANGYLYWEAIKQIALGFAALLAVWGISMGRGMYGSYMAYWKHRDKLTEQEYENVRQAYIHFALAILGAFAILFDENPQVYSLLPVLPMEAFGCAFVANNTLIRLCNRSTDITNGILATAAVVLITIGMVINFSSIDRYRPDDQDVLHDLQVILPAIKEDDTVSVTPEMFENDGARAYFLRYKNISFDTHLVHPFLLTMQPKIDNLNTQLQYHPSAIATKTIFLYEAVADDEPMDGAWDFNAFE